MLQSLFSTSGTQLVKHDFTIFDPQDKRESLVRFIKSLDPTGFHKKIHSYLNRNACKNVSVFTK